MMKSKTSFFPIFLIILGCIFLIDNLGLLNNAWYKLWPLVLVGIGFSLIYNSIKLKY